MKKLFIAMAVIASIGLIGCNDDLENIEIEVSSLQDSLNIVINQHNALLDSVSYLIEMINDSDTADINALKMAQLASLFESISRQPEAYNILINATEMLYFDYTELLPFSDKTIEQRGLALGSLFDGIARQPGAYSKFDSAATKFLGEFNPSYMSDDFIEGKTRGLAFSNLFDGIARQPEAHGKFDSTATKFLGVYNPAYFSAELLDVSKVYAVDGLTQSLARQPEADSLFNLVCIKFFNFDFLD